jgi:cobalt/nickel transport system permease protein
MEDSCYCENEPMHIPDGLLSVPVCAATGVAGGAGVLWMARRAQAEAEESRVPLLGAMGAFVFAAQMINFPVGVGTTGHLLGSALLAFTLGPAPAVVVMAAILAVQALVFQDGGVLALGANVLNMAVVGVLAGYLPYRLMGRTGARRLAVFAGAALSVMASALLALAELRLSGVLIPAAVLGLSLGLFAVNAIVEGAVTLGAAQALEALHPGWIRKPPAAIRKPALAAVGLAAVLLATGSVWIASSAPDGIQSLAARLDISSRARSWLPAPLRDYRADFLPGSWLGKAAAGLAGLALVSGASAWIGRVRRHDKGR